MYVTVAHRRLPVRIENDVRTDAGDCTYELFRPAAMDIALDVTTPPSERGYYLVHALGHAWEHLVGRVDPTDNEGIQNRIATINSQLSIDLANQGGEMCLHALFGDTEPPAESDLTEPNYSTGSAEDVDWPTDQACPSCQQIYPDRAVRNGKPYFNAKVGGYCLNRVLVCGTCDRESRWTVRCSQEGTPWPVIVSPPQTRLLTAD